MYIYINIHRPFNLFLEPAGLVFNLTYLLLWVLSIDIGADQADHKLLTNNLGVFFCFCFFNNKWDLL